VRSRPAVAPKAKYVPNVTGAAPRPREQTQPTIIAVCPEFFIRATTVVP
jgi:hypothetical protein